MFVTDKNYFGKISTLDIYIVYENVKSVQELS